MQPVCATRAVKVLKYLNRMAPQTISRSSLQALEKLPSSVLSRLDTISDWNKVTNDPELKDWLVNNPIPRSEAQFSGALFHGALVFVQLIFQKPDQPPSSITLADVQMALAYATLAVVPIHQYALQYGPNSVSVWPNVIPFTANLSDDSFTLAEFEGWVDDIAQFMHTQQVANPCIVVLHNRDLPNSGAFLGERDSFHSVTGNGTLYCYSLVFGENLSVADNNHTINGRANDKVYAHNLSHEIAEMVADPLGSDARREVCDPCSDGYCGRSFFDLFDQDSLFLGGTEDTTTASGFAFFINSIVSSGATLNAKGCVVGDAQSACIYAPPPLPGQLLSYADDGTPGNVSGPVVVGLGGWLQFKFLFAGKNLGGENWIYAVDPSGELLSYSDDGIPANVSDPVVVGFGGWLQFKSLFAGKNLSGENRIYAVDPAGQLLSYTDDGNPGNVSAPVEVGFDGWLQFKSLFAGGNASGANRIYAVVK